MCIIVIDVIHMCIVCIIIHIIYFIGLTICLLVCAGVVYCHYSISINISVLLCIYCKYNVSRSIHV